MDKVISISANPALIDSNDDKTQHKAPLWWWSQRYEKVMELQRHHSEAPEGESHEVKISLFDRQLRKPKQREDMWRENKDKTWRNLPSFPSTFISHFLYFDTLCPLRKFHRGSQVALSLKAHKVSEKHEIEGGDTSPVLTQTPLKLFSILAMLFGKTEHDDCFSSPLFRPRGLTTKMPTLTRLLTSCSAIVWNEESLSNFLSVWTESGMKKYI